MATNLGQAEDDGYQIRQDHLGGLVCCLLGCTCGVAMTRGVEDGLNVWLLSSAELEVLF